MTTENRREDRLRRAFILLLLLGVAAVFFTMIRPFLIALFLAGIFTALLFPVQRRVREWFGGRERLAAAAVLVGALLAVGLPLLGMLGMVAAEAVQVSAKVTPWLRQQLQADQALGGHLPDWLPYAQQLEPYRQTIFEKLGQAVGATGQFLVSSIPSLTQGTIAILLDAFILIYAMYYFLVNGADILEAGKRYLPLQEDDRNLIVERGYAVTRASLKGILVIGLLQGVLVALGFWAAGLEGAAFWGALVVILSAIPGLGAPIIWVPAALYLFLTGDIGWAIALTVWGALVVGAVDNILRPVVVGRDARLPDLLILVGTLGGIGMFGAAGIIIGPVIAAIVITSLDIYRRVFIAEASSGSGS